MAYSYVASSSQGNASGGALTVNKPSGTLDGHNIVVVGYLESDTNTWTSVGSGFVSVVTATNTGAFTVTLWYKWASGEPSSWTWTPNTSSWRTVVSSSYSGGGGSGDARDVSGTNQGDAQLAVNQTAPSVTTTADNDIVIYGYGNFSGTNVTATAGFATNLRVSFGGATIADANKTPAGSTGTTFPNGGPGTDDFGALHAGLFLSPGGGGGGPAPNPASFYQSHFRYYNNDGGAQTATALESEDANTTQPAGTVVHLRVQIDKTAGDNSVADPNDFQIEYKRLSEVDNNYRRLR